MNLIASLAIAAVVGTHPTGDPDAVIATAPDTVVVLEGQPTVLADPGPVAQDPTAPAHGLTTDQQIARWISNRSGQEQAWKDLVEADAGAPNQPRKMHGEVFGSIGTGGHRAWGASVVLPIGEDATLGLSVMQGRSMPWEYGYGPVDRYGYGGWAAGEAYPDHGPSRLRPSGQRRIDARAEAVD